MKCNERVVVEHIFFFRSFSLCLRDVPPVRSNKIAQHNDALQHRNSRRQGKLDNAIGIVVKQFPYKTAALFSAKARKVAGRGVRL